MHIFFIILNIVNEEILAQSDSSQYSQNGKENTNL